MTFDISILFKALERLFSFQKTVIGIDQGTWVELRKTPDQELEIDVVSLNGSDFAWIDAEPVENDPAFDASGRCDKKVSLLGSARLIQRTHSPSLSLKSLKLDESNGSFVMLEQTSSKGSLLIEKTSSKGSLLIERVGSKGSLLMEKTSSKGSLVAANDDDDDQDTFLTDLLPILQSLTKYTQPSLDLMIQTIFGDDDSWFIGFM